MKMATPALLLDLVTNCIGFPGSWVTWEEVKTYGASRTAVKTLRAL